MTVTFTVDYFTHPGEEINIVCECADGNAVAFPMHRDSDGLLKATLPSDVSSGYLSYHYELRSTTSGQCLRREWGKPRRIQLPAEAGNMTVNDKWHDRPYDKPFFSSAFTDSIFRHTQTPAILAPENGYVIFYVSAPTLRPDMQLKISGNCEMLGNWNPDKAPSLSPQHLPIWAIKLQRSTLPSTLEFKFIVCRNVTTESVIWEDGANRIWQNHSFETSSAIVESDMVLRHNSTPWRGTGTAIPVFSLRSKQGFGTGEFMDLKHMVDWAALTGQQFLQLLPINDTTMTHRWTDSYPYTTNSSFALHPMYLRLEDVGNLDEASRKEYNGLRKQLNNKPAIDYEAVNNAKRHFSHILYSLYAERDLNSEDYRKFFMSNSHWLKPYSAWSVLRDIYHTPDMSLWGEYSQYNINTVEHFISAHTEEIRYYYFIQYHLDRQLKDVRAYADKKGVVLKGDIPIGISRNSVDAWLNPELFNLDSTAGAPPDAFAKNGQNWGFPTYRWDVMKADGYSWWRARLSKMAEYFSAYRIDHLLGFFRIWEIPADTYHGILGTFSPALPFTPEELREKYGFVLKSEIHTHPYITESTLEDIFGNNTDKAIKNFVHNNPDGKYSLKFKSQHEAFTYCQTNNIAQDICTGIISLFDDVLFIEDRRIKGLFHPRINGHETESFRNLPHGQQEAYRKLHEDFFYHRHNDFWREEAIGKLTAITEATPMLACAEDLGMIPECVAGVMDELRILSLEIQRMPKEAWVEFANTSRYPYLSVCATSTHDMAGIRGWWEENPDSRQRFYKDIMHCDGKAPDDAEPWICGEIIRMHVDSPSMLCILPLQDWLSTDGTIRRKSPCDEQINVPANPRHYWRYRMHLNLEDMLNLHDFNSRIREVVNHRSLT